MPISGPNDIERMQRDAEHRIREMQKKADRAVRGNDMPPVPNFVRINQGRQQNQNRNQNQSQNQSQNQLRGRGQNSQGISPPTDRIQSENRRENSTQGQQKGGLLSRFKGLDILKIFNFKNIRLDSDVLIIIALIFLLSTEETDELLIMALIYIML